MKTMIRILSLCLSILLLMGLLAACGAEPAETTAGATETTAEPTEPKRELTAVGEPMRHMTYNIAGSLGTERIQMFYLEGREAKKNNIKAIIEELDPETICIQEASEDWREGLPPFLDNKYAIAGKDNEEVPRPEFWLNPILYKVDTFTCLDEGVYWLTESLKKVSTSRSCSYALLERISDGELLFVISVHVNAGALGTEDMRQANFAYNVDDANRSYSRDLQVSVIRKIVDDKMAEYAETHDKEISVIVSGDFNIDEWTNEKFSFEYDRLLETMATSTVGKPLYDTTKVCANLIHNQSMKTYQTYRLKDSKQGAYLRIDYNFVSENLMVENNIVYNTPYPVGESSDHHPSYIDYTIAH